MSGPPNSKDFLASKLEQYIARDQAPIEENTGKRAPVRTVQDVLDVIAKYVAFGGGGGGAASQQSASTASIVQYVYTCTAGQTIIQGADDNGRLLNLDSENVTVFRSSGLVPVGQYSIDPTSDKITLITPASAAEKIQVLVIVGNLSNIPTTSAFVTETFISDGVTSYFNLLSKPSATNQLFVFERGVYQKPSSYSIDSTSDPYRVVFAQPFPAGAEVSVNAFLVNAPDSVSSTQVEYNDGTGTVALSAALDAIFNSLPDGVFKTINGNVGSTVANSPSDTLTIRGDGALSTTVVGDEVILTLAPGGGSVGSASKMPPLGFYDYFEDFGLDSLAVFESNSNKISLQAFHAGVGNTPSGAAYIQAFLPTTSGIGYQSGGSNPALAGRRGLIQSLYFSGTTPTALMRSTIYGAADTASKNGSVSSVGSAKASSIRYLAASIAHNMPTGCTIELSFCGGRQSNTAPGFSGATSSQFLSSLTAGNASAYSFYFTQGTHSFWQCRITNGSTITDVATTVPVPTKAAGTFFMPELYYNPALATLAFKVGSNSWTYDSFGTLTALDEVATGWGISFGKLSGVTATTAATGTEGVIVDWVRSYVSDIGQTPVSPSFSL
jgi:hypothetical protein